MKKIAIVGLSVALTACVSGDYVTDVTSESYREDYKVPKMEQTVMHNMNEAMAEKPMEAQAVKPVVMQSQQKAKPAVAIIPPTAKQTAMNPRYGFTIQVVAVGSQAKVDQFARKLPREGQPIWENYKVVNGTKWYTVLYGDYATRKDAKKAISELSAEFQQLKPFVKSIDDIKNSEFPTLNKLN